MVESYIAPEYTYSKSRSRVDSVLTGRHDEATQDIQDQPVQITLDLDRSSVGDVIHDRTATSFPEEAQEGDPSYDVALPRDRADATLEVEGLVIATLEKLVAEHNPEQKWASGWEETFGLILSERRMPDIITEEVRRESVSVVEAYEARRAAIAHVALEELLLDRSSHGVNVVEDYLGHAEQVLSIYCRSNAEVLASLTPNQAGPEHRRLRSRSNIIDWLTDVAKGTPP